MGRCHRRSTLALSLFENMFHFTGHYLPLTNTHQTSHNVAHLSIHKALASNTDRIQIHRATSIGTFKSRSRAESHVMAKQRMRTRRYFNVIQRHNWRQTLTILASKGRKVVHSNQCLCCQVHFIDIQWFIVAHYSPSSVMFKWYTCISLIISTYVKYPIAIGATCGRETYVPVNFFRLGTIWLASIEFIWCSLWCRQHVQYTNRILQ